jgi:hypothetical protein
MRSSVVLYSRVVIVGAVVSLKSKNGYSIRAFSNNNRQHKKSKQPKFDRLKADASVLLLACSVLIGHTPER